MFEISDCRLSPRALPGFTGNLSAAERTDCTQRDLHMQASVNAQVLLGARVQLTCADGDGFEARGKSAVLLAMAALEGSAERRRMALLLWPESKEQQARNNLRTLVHRLNQRFGAELLAGTELLAIDPARAQVALPDTRALVAALAGGSAARCETWPMRASTPTCPRP